jgi:serine/threonine protein kinase
MLQVDPAKRLSAADCLAHSWLEEHHDASDEIEHPCSTTFTFDSDFSFEDESQVRQSSVSQRGHARKRNAVCTCCGSPSCPASHSSKPLARALLCPGLPFVPLREKLTDGWAPLYLLFSPMFVGGQVNWREEMWGEVRKYHPELGA